MKKAIIATLLTSLNDLVKSYKETILAVPEETHNLIAQGVMGQAIIKVDFAASILANIDKDDHQRLIEDLGDFSSGISSEAFIYQVTGNSTLGDNIPNLITFLENC